MTDFAPVGPSTYSPNLWCPLLEDHETTCFQTLQTSKSYAENHVTSASHLTTFRERVFERFSSSLPTWFPYRTATTTEIRHGVTRKEFVFF